MRLPPNRIRSDSSCTSGKNPSPKSCISLILIALRLGRRTCSTSNTKRKKRPFTGSKSLPSTVRAPATLRFTCSRRTAVTHLRPPSTSREPSENSNRWFPGAYSVKLILWLWIQKNEPKSMNNSSSNRFSMLNRSSPSTLVISPSIINWGLMLPGTVIEMEPLRRKAPLAKSSPWVQTSSSANRGRSRRK